MGRQFGPDFPQLLFTQAYHSGRLSAGDAYPAGNTEDRCWGTCVSSLRRQHVEFRCGNRCFLSNTLRVEQLSQFLCGYEYFMYLYVSTMP